MELNKYEKSYYSQNGEDGIIQEILKRISLQTDFFVEFGVESGLQCNCRYLYENLWRGLMIEGNGDYYKQLRSYYNNVNIKTVNSFITKDNIVEIFKKNKVPIEFGLLSVDIDGNDYWVLKEILGIYTPFIIVSEFNAYYEPPIEWIMKYNSYHIWDGTSYFGSSLQSLTKLCNRFNYALVCTDSKGVNAFYVRRDLLNDNLIELAPSQAYHPARYYGHLNNGKYGHPYRDGEHTKE
ncbi:hypothetical protein [Neobacillus sp. NPDC093127]|uniref:hypothetical protein n=1 Tax=Neobacillus sp. NPDC093127 TaxID=3364296 RepID=UPI003818F3B1